MYQQQFLFIFEQINGCAPSVCVCKTFVFQSCQQRSCRYTLCHYFYHSISPMATYDPTRFWLHKQVPSVSSCPLSVQLNSSYKQYLMSPKYTWVFLVVYFPPDPLISRSIEGTFVLFSTYDQPTSFIFFRIRDILYIQVNSRTYLKL